MSAILRCPSVWWWWYLGGAPHIRFRAPHLSLCSVCTTSILSLILVHLLAHKAPLKQPDHSDKVTDLMLSDIIKLRI